MHRKILGICVALIALGAFAIAPSMASAHTLQDTEGGLTVKVTKPIIADSEGISKFNASFGVVECNENILTGSIAKNDGTTVEGTIEAAWFQSNFFDANNKNTKCRGPFGEEVTVTIPQLTNGGGTKHWCIKTVPNTDNFEVWGNNCGTEVGSGEFTFILDFPSMTCSYKRTTAIKGDIKETVTAAHEAATLTLSEIPTFTTDTSSSIFCPASGSLEEFKFNLYTDTEGAFSKVHSVHPFGAQPTVDPVFLNKEA